ncbi:MAG: type II toxin-antitoxin system VapC family toxin [Gammaproteobacteria bacterium]|nr:type II toxin-antitoxin system VapC family toxin [Gammaproteobacteria bacterium]
MSCVPPSATTFRTSAASRSCVAIGGLPSKRALGKLTAPTDLEPGIARQGFSALPITFHHAEVAGALPRHHADPFDRMLIAQAQSEALTLVTRNNRMGLYGVTMIEA